MSNATNPRGGPIGGRFETAPGEDFQLYSTSMAVDLRMLDEDVDGSIAHATMLAEVGILTAEEAATIREGLEQVRREIKAGEFVPGDELEDVHMAVEVRMTQLVGEIGKKLHTARSRNDQVATDVRLWVLRRLDALDAALRDLISALLERVERDGQILVPGYTHLQRGQPILFGHHLLAHAWALQRDRERFADARKRVDRSPLGGCAMAGTPHPIDRERTAELLGFGEVMENAMDAVAARDHEQEVAAACAMCMSHLSRQAEEMVNWSTSEFRFVRLGEGYTTGSSIMPQKRNPDAPELVRGKTSHVYGYLVSLLSLTKNVVMSYNRDFQEDREPLFNTVETTLDSVRIQAAVWRTATFDADRFEADLDGDFSLATELADYLVNHDVPFREAHEIVGSIVRWCEQRGENLKALTPEVGAEFHASLGEDLSEVLDPRAAADRRTSRGGTAWPEIERQVGLLRGLLDG